MGWTQARIWAPKSGVQDGAVVVLLEDDAGEAQVAPGRIFEMAGGVVAGFVQVEAVASYLIVDVQSGGIVYDLAAAGEGEPG